MDEEIELRERISRIEDSIKQMQVQIKHLMNNVFTEDEFKRYGE